MNRDRQLLVDRLLVKGGVVVRDQSAGVGRHERARVGAELERARRLVRGLRRLRSDRHLREVHAALVCEHGYLIDAVVVDVMANPKDFSPVGVHSMVRLGS